MARWLVTDGNRQYSVRDFNELRQLASQGRIGPGTMIQPPGASDWLYASEVPQLKDVLSKAAAAPLSDADFKPPRTAGSQKPILIVLGALILVGGVVFWRYASSIPDVKDLELLGGSHGLELSQMLVTEAGAPLRSSPNASSGASRKLEKDSRLTLLAKQKGWYNVRTEEKAEGWVAVDEVVPAYYFADEKEREALDPLYNPDKYLAVENSRWMQLPPDEKAPKGTESNITVFEFSLNNTSRFEMTNLKLLATIKDRRGKVLEEKEIEVAGSVPPYESVPVGTLNPPEKDKTGTPKQPYTQSTFITVAKGNEDMWLRWSEGIEVTMSSIEYSEADITLLQVQAVLPPEKAKKK